jgi:hypothetical protein
MKRFNWRTPEYCFAIRLDRRSPRRRDAARSDGKPSHLQLGWRRAGLQATDAKYQLHVARRPSDLRDVEAPLEDLRPP